MIQTGKYLAIWIHDEAARLFLGLQRKPEELSRWAFIGKVITEPDSVGVWLSINSIQEREFGGGILKTWTVSPDTCLIRWEYIITAQLLGEEIGDTRKIGFHAGPT